MALGSSPRGQIFSGARARFTINGTVIGYATNCTGSEEIMYEPIEVLDHLQVVEFVPVGYRVSFSAGRVRLIGDNVGTNGSLRGQLAAFPRLGQDDQEFLLNILNQDDLQCQIEDSVGTANDAKAKIFMRLEHVRVASRNWSITPRGVVGEDVGFVAVRMLDEIEAN